MYKKIKKERYVKKNLNLKKVLGKKIKIVFRSNLLFFLSGIRNVYLIIYYLIKLFNYLF